MRLLISYFVQKSESPAHAHRQYLRWFHWALRDDSVNHVTMATSHSNVNPPHILYIHFLKFLCNIIASMLATIHLFLSSCIASKQQPWKLHFKDTPWLQLLHYSPKPTKGHFSVKNIHFWTDWHCNCCLQGYWKTGSQEPTKTIFFTFK